MELPSQLALLRAMSCDSVQGYLTGRPVPSAEVAELRAVGRLTPPLGVPGNLVHVRA